MSMRKLGRRLTKKYSCKRWGGVGEVEPTDAVAAMSRLLDSMRDLPPQQVVVGTGANYIVSRQHSKQKALAGR